MEGGDCAKVKMASFRVAGFSDVLDWRPMLFQEPIIAQRACVLCGVLYKNAVRLPCVHTLCVKCHAQCVDEGSACPVDQQAFSEDDVEQLKVSLKYILNRKVACWNAPRGCSFISPVACLLDHYKECEFSTLSCCLCSSSVLQNNILEHFKVGCSRDTCESADDHPTQDLQIISRDCLEMRKAMGNISENLMSLQTSLNQCSEGVRADDTKCKGQWGAEASRLTEQLKDLSLVCTTGFAKELEVLQAAVTDYKEHVSKELQLQRAKLSVVLRPKTVHWYIENWAELKKQAVEGGYIHLDSPIRTVHGYNVSQCIELQREDNQVRFGCYMHLKPGEHDVQLEWPFRNVYTIGVIHPKDQSNVISFKVNANWYEDLRCFHEPKGNGGFGRPHLSTAEKLEEDGFVQNDKLHLFLEIEP
ncbi:hypothetical protein HPB47_014005 [Ixodes persulcatus]|uniref:Uncharacterized protein n=1 Tax=Ixodes persulcatus TaxID=34615 RepID=A0AC60QZM5_IXOPE|nr:hypothetical protein HPB47_014005 [Ixodes persulcatus]